MKKRNSRKLQPWRRANAKKEEERWWQEQEAKIIDENERKRIRRNRLAKQRRKIAGEYDYTHGLAHHKIILALKTKRKSKKY